ncbi:hypothetical protein E3U44_10760 [Nitrosococcus wardiae]|uniref:Uncharacterized protein n=1 Tax=Nitrosococcus wardiae TaxID=1814290 RepID=A0A4P7BXR4_9GAMM|nr:hypothetical protein E3U44_10760 [Nitrosococcus wardiae]
MKALTRNHLTMSSLEIAKLCKKQHGHVMRDIKELDKQGILCASKFGGTYPVRGKRIKQDAKPR